MTENLPVDKAIRNLRKGGWSDFGSQESSLTENLSIDKVTVLDSGNGNGMPTYVKGVTGSVVAIMEQIKNATGLDIPDILRAKSRPELTK